MMTFSTKQMKLGVIGAGNMGQAIMAAACRDFTILACDKDRRKLAAVRRKWKVASLPLEELMAKSRVILLAVKPQDFPQLLAGAAAHLEPRHLVISIAAGMTTATIERRLGGRPRVIRAMPNMPAQIGEGITAVCRGRYAKKSDEDLTMRIFTLVGRTVRVKERLMDAVTAVSGSGPAYVFFVAECLREAARAAGLSGGLAVELVEATLAGSARQLAESGMDPAVLRQKVTSKGGTTEAAMKVLIRRKIEAAFKEAVRAARRRARALSQ